MGVSILENSLRWPVEKRAIASIALDNNYPNPQGYAIHAKDYGLSRFTRLELLPEQGYVFEFAYPELEPETVYLHVFESSGGTTSSVSGGTPAGTVGAPVFTGSALAGHGHDIAIADNGGTPVGVAVYYDPATSTLNADKGAGTDVATTSVSAGTPAGTNSAPAFTGSALAGHAHGIGASAQAEVPNGTDLSALDDLQISVWGY